MSLLKPQERPNIEISGLEIVEALYFLERLTLDSCRNWTPQEWDFIKRNFNSIIKSFVNKRI